MNALAIQEHLHWVFNLDRRQLGVGKLGAVVDLDLGKPVSRDEEPHGPFKEVNGVPRRNVVIQVLDVVIETLMRYHKITPDSR